MVERQRQGDERERKEIKEKEERERRDVLIKTRGRRETMKKGESNRRKIPIGGIERKDRERKSYRRAKERRNRLKGEC